MPSTEIILRSDKRGNWVLVAPKGHTLSTPFRGSQFQAEEWARAWISGFHNWTIKVEQEIEGDTDEKKD